MSKEKYDPGTMTAIVLIVIVTSGLTVLLASQWGTDDDGTSEKGDDLTFTFNPKFVEGFVAVGGNSDGESNPDINAKVGDTITIILISVEEVAHDITIDEFGVKSPLVASAGDFEKETTVTFTIDQGGEFAYYCSVAGHRATMEGRIIVGLAIEPEAAKPVDVASIMRDPADVGTPVSPRATTTTVEYTLVAKEVVANIEDDVTFSYWTYNSTTPGPIMRVMLGDTVIINLDNDISSNQEHSIDLHAVTGPGGGAGVNNGNGTAVGGPNGTLRALPGARSTLKFVAHHEGSFVYHCASPHIPTHISKGMFGAIIVEPVGGLTPVENEFYIGQNEVYTKFKSGTPGHNIFDDSALYDEEPNYVLFNGKYHGLTGDNAMQVNQSDDVRIFFAVGGPNLISSFHMIGEIWDRVYYETWDTPMLNAETVLVAPGSVLMVELTMEVVGSYLLVDHALSRVFDKGCLAIITVT